MSGTASHADLVAQAVRPGRPVHVDDTNGESDLRFDAARRAGMRAATVIPLVDHGQVMAAGVLRP